MEVKRLLHRHGSAALKFADLKHIIDNFQETGRLPERIPSGHHRDYNSEKKAGSGNYGTAGLLT